ncbi:unnamed protein product [Cochlearia groenlandica]
MVDRLEAQGRKNPEKRYEWDDKSDHDDVTKVSVRGDSKGIQHICFSYVKSGKSVQGSNHGVKEQGFTQTFEINHLNDEQLESVEGYYDPNSNVINGLQFKTNFRISELIGFTKDCTKFLLSIDGKKIIGFHGSTGMSLNSLGAYFTLIAPTKLDAKGGQGGIEWKDGSDHDGVTKINIGGGRKGIQYIKFDYIKNGKHINGPDHGVKGRSFMETFEINHLNNEYLISIEGYYDSEVIQGLEFKTNIKSSGLIGYDDGNKFTLASNGKKIIGFHGYAEKNLNSLGAYFKGSSPFIKLACKGDTTRGRLWDDGAFDGIRKVYVTYGKDYVWRVTFDYDDRGEIKKLEHGSMDGQKGEFEIDYPNEFITIMEGTLYTIGNDYASIASLTFRTSKGRTSLTFGNATNKTFVLESKGCCVVGFHGWSTGALEGIGAYFRPLSPPPKTEKIEAKGGDEGAFWDDGGFDGVRKIYVGRSDNAIAFVKFMYYKEARMVFGDDHGNKTHLFGVQEFELNYPTEYVTSVEGSYDDKSGAMTMLRFKTNTQTSPDFGLGTSTNTSFVLNKTDHMIVGFHGKSSNILHKIGVHVKPISP